MNLEDVDQAQVVADQAKPPTVEPTTPETGREPVEGQPQEPQTQEPSQLSQEQHDALRRGMNEAQRERAEAQAQNQLLLQQLAERNNALAQFGTQHVQNQDPLAAAEAELATAQREYPETFDAVKVSNATLKLAAAQRQREREEDRQQMRYEQTVNNQMPVAAKILGVSDQAAAQVQLANRGKALTPVDLAILERFHAGTLPEYLEAQNKQQLEEREAAKFFTSLSEPGGARRVPGSNEQKVDGQISYWQWLAGSEEFREGQRNSDKNIQVTGAPPGFDPMKE